MEAATAVAEPIQDLEPHDGRLMSADVHAGRPMRPEFADRGARLMAAWELGWWSV